MKEIRPAILMLILFTVICGGIYPAVVTGIAQAVFPNQANGSFITGKRRQGTRFGPDRPALFRPKIFLAASLGGH
jgi:K+-transporting ATPase c subunit